MAEGSSIIRLASRISQRSPRFYDIRGLALRPDRHARTRMVTLLHPGKKMGEAEPEAESYTSSSLPRNKLGVQRQSPGIAAAARSFGPRRAACLRQRRADVVKNSAYGRRNMLDAGNTGKGDHGHKQCVLDQILAGFAVPQFLEPHKRLKIHPA